MAGEWSEEMRAAARERAERGRRLPKGAGSVYQTTVRGANVWRAAITVRADEYSPPKRIIGTSADRAVAIRRRDRLVLEWQVQQGKVDRSALVGGDERRSWTVAEWFEKWGNEQSPTKVQANTRERNRGLIKNHITPHLGMKTLPRVTTEDITKLLNDTLPSKTNADGTRQLGASPLRGVFYILKAGFLEAEKEGLITTSPLKYLTAPPKPRGSREIASRLPDLPKILTYLDAHQEDYDYWILSLYGLRASERLGLQWDSITNLYTDFFKPAVLTIDRQLYNDAEARKLYIKKDTKTEAGRRKLPLPDDVRAALIRVKLRQQEQMKEQSWNQPPKFKGLVFTTKTGGAIRQAKDNARWRELIKQIGIPPLHGHDMRHITASFLAEAGIPPEVAKALIGHSSEAMTSYYTHISEKRSREALNQLSAVYAANLAAGKSGVDPTRKITLTKFPKVDGLPKERLRDGAVKDAAPLLVDAAAAAAELARHDEKVAVIRSGSADKEQ